MNRNTNGEFESVMASSLQGQKRDGKDWNEDEQHEHDEHQGTEDEGR